MSMRPYRRLARKEFDDDDIEELEVTPPDPQSPLVLLSGPAPWTECPECLGGPETVKRGDAADARLAHNRDCPTCEGVGLINVPTSDADFHATAAGSLARVAIMSARYRAGLTVFPE